MDQRLESGDRGRATAFLYGRIDYERRLIPVHDGFRLDRMKCLMKGLGNPQERLPAIHIAGTKGKGSTAAMLHQVSRAAGYNVGLYTSPHLEKLEERFVVAGQPCSSEQLDVLVQQLKPIISEVDEQSPPGEQLTFFEITTALAMLYFEQQQVDFAILEVGLGGRLDSTNVCQPAVSVITNIGLDHMHLLGDTLEKIASEKAGIIKPAVPVVSGARAPAAAAVIEQAARDNHSPLIQIGRDFDCHARDENGEELIFDFHAQVADERFQYQQLRCGIPGRHQLDNAAVALATLALMQERWPTSDDALERGLATVHCPARLELVPSSPRVLLDVAHNLPSIQALAGHIDTRIEAQRRVLVFACSRDKDIQSMLPELLPRFDEVILTRFVDNPRSHEPDHLKELAQQWLIQHPADSFHERRPGLHLAEDPAGAWQLAQRLAGVDDLICIAGSFFLAAELRPLLPVEAGAETPIP